MLLYRSEGAWLLHGSLAPVLGGGTVTKQLQAAVSRTAGKRSKPKFQVPYEHTTPLHSIRQTGKTVLESEGRKLRK